MKLLAFAAVGLIGFSAFARDSKKPAAKDFRIYEHIEFQKDTYYDDLNLTGDGVDIAEGYRFVGYSAIFKVAQGEQFKISSDFISASNANGICPYNHLVVKSLENNESQISVDFDTDDVKVDSGDKCQYTIETAAGHKAVITIFSESM